MNGIQQALFLLAALFLISNDAGGQNNAVSQSKSAGGGGNPTAEVIETQKAGYRATITGIEQDGIRVQLPTGERFVGFGGLRSLIFAPRDAEPRSRQGSIAVSLSDGSQFTCLQLDFDGSMMQCRLDEQRSLALAPSQIVSCQLQTLSEVQMTQWHAITASRLSSDMLVLIRSAEALDKIEGLIRRIEPETVKFEFDGQLIDAPRGRLAGLRFFNKDGQPPVGKLMAILHEKNGTQWMTKSVRTSQNAASALECELMCGASMRVPVSSLAEIDFSQGNTRYLTELEPLERKSQAELKGLKIAGFGELFGPAAVQTTANNDTTSTPPVLQFLGAGWITYRVPDGFRRLLGSVELSPDGTHFVPCKLRVFQEDKQLVEKTLLEPRQPVAVELAVEEGKRVRLVVESDASHPVGNIVLWKQLRFAK